MLDNQLYALPHEFKHQDKVYKVSPLTGEVKAGFATRLYRRMKEALAYSKTELSRSEYADALMTLNARYQEGEYDFDSTAGREYALSESGSVTLVTLLWNVTPAEAKTLIREQPEEVVALLKVILAEAYPEIREAMEEKEGGKKAVNFQEAAKN